MTISLTDFAHENNTDQFEIAYNISSSYDKRYVADLTLPDLLAKMANKCAHVNCRFKALMM